MENLVINKKFTTPIEQNDILKKNELQPFETEKARIETAR